VGSAKPICASVVTPSMWHTYKNRVVNTPAQLIILLEYFAAAGAVLCVEIRRSSFIQCNSLAALFINIQACYNSPMD